MRTGRRMSSVVVAVILALVGVYVAVPAEAVRAVIWMMVGVASVTAIIVAVLRNRPADPLPWWLFAAGTGLLANGQAVSLIGGSQPFTDVPRLLAYPTLTMAVVAINGSFFHGTKVESSVGLIMKGGEIIADSGHRRTSLGINKDGTFVMGIPKIRTGLYYPDSNRFQRVNGINQPRKAK